MTFSIKVNFVMRKSVDCVSRIIRQQQREQ
jgi:hypothetical protein